MKKWLFLAMMLFLVPLTADAQISKWLNKFGLNKNTSLSDTKIGQGLKETLSLSIEGAIKELSKKDGYFKNQAVKILMPEKLNMVKNFLYSAGQGSKVDDFELSMNRAAEKAAPLAADIFSTAIADLTFDDAAKIIKGKNTAATDYLKKKTYPKLIEKFKPSVEKTMNSYKVTKKFKDIAGKAKNLALSGQTLDVDIDEYVTTKTLDGLFSAMAEEETKIRQNPTGQATSLIQELFKK